MSIYVRLFPLILPIIKCQNLLTKTNDDSKIENQDIHNYQRFEEDLDDYEFHTAHLKNAEFDGRRDCATDTFEDRVKRHRKALLNDGALVTYVSADAIPVKESEILEDTCKLDPNKASSKFGTNFDELRPKTPTTIVPKGTVNDTSNDTTKKESDVTPSVTDKVTTPTRDHKVTPHAEKEKADGNEESDEGQKESARRGEYMFSSVEYYDDVPDFDDKICPDAVEMIELEIDALRKYDIECENMIEWRSLDIAQPA